MKDTIQLFKALSDPTRVRIIWLLQYGGELCVCDLMAVLELPQSTVSRHLAYLRYSGIVDDQRKGVWMYYCLKDSVNELLLSILKAIEGAATNVAQAETDRQRLVEYLKTKQSDAC